MSSAEDKAAKPDDSSSQRWTNALLIIATVAAVSGVLALLFRPEASPGIEVSLPTSTPPPRLMVYVSGAVAQPGVYQFQEGDRLQDIIGSAGGLLAEADISTVNMAALLEDEQHFHFPTILESKEVAAYPSADSSTNNQSPTPEAAPSPENPIDLNTASAEELQTLPGIGVVKAEAIVEFRDTYGPFGKTSEITSVPGIGPATYENMQHLITVAPIDP